MTSLSSATVASSGTDASSPYFFLVGNGPYLNRGCEAIVRGTTRILDEAFGEETSYLVASTGTEPQIAAQAAGEVFPRLRHAWLKPNGRGSVDYFKYQLNRFFGIQWEFCEYRIPPEAVQCRAALQIGGDNYSLDYGYPRGFMQIDRWLERRGVPLVLWGASVGPFDRDPAFEREIVAHLARFSLITLRESRSYRYLQALGLNNIVLVADPAFLLEPQAVVDLSLPPAFVGINLSCLSGKVVTHGNVNQWISMCAQALSRLLSICELPVVLIPHVMTSGSQKSDLAFLQAVRRTVRDTSRITILEADYTAAQLKWVIGKATVFAGARTHSTIAALSMKVPTLSLAYSVKAWGLNEDVFGHTAYCMDVSELAQEDSLAERIQALRKETCVVRSVLARRIPALQADAMRAGVVLRERLNSRR